MSGDFLASQALSLACLRGKALDVSKINPPFPADLCEALEVAIRVTLCYTLGAGIVVWP